MGMSLAAAYNPRMISNTDRGCLAMPVHARPRVLAIGAYPGDLEIGAAGTLALLSRRGAKVTLAVVCLPGDLATRRAQAEAAAATLGCDIRFLTPDRPSRLEDYDSAKLTEMVEEVVSEECPDLLLTHMREPRRDCALYRAEAAVSARRQSMDHLRYSVPTGRGHSSAGSRPEAFVDVTFTFETKMEALRAHAARFGCSSDSVDRFRHSARAGGDEVAKGYAERFRIARVKLFSGLTDGVWMLEHESKPG